MRVWGSGGVTSAAAAERGCASQQALSQPLESLRGSRDAAAWDRAAASCAREVRDARGEACVHAGDRDACRGACLK